MHLGYRLLPATLAVSLAIAFPPCPWAQDPAAHFPASADLPEAPPPQIALAGTGLAGEQAPPAQNPTPPPPPSGPAASSSSESPSQQPSEKSQRDIAEEQLRQQEKQRVMGVMATFNTTRNMDAAPLSPRQKFKLFIKSATDPWPFGLSAFVAGIGQADNSNPEWGQGMQGYAKRFGAGYSDYFIGNFFGNAVLPSLLHEDPRYFQKGTGSTLSRFLWAASSTVWCRRDKGTWGPNYANVGGNLVGSAIARVYYPDSSRTVSDTISDGITVSVEGIVGAEVIEFWPDLVRMHQRKQAQKLARAQAAADQKAAPNQK